MSENFYSLMTSVESRYAHQLAYSIHMVSDIAAEYDHRVDKDDFLAARAMLDAFFVHLRALAEFLVKPTDSRHFGPADFGVEWTIPTSNEARRLRDKHWLAATLYVVHFTRDRVPEDIDDLRAFEISGRAFTAMATDALIVCAEFVRRLEASTPPWSGGADIPDRQTEPEAWNARNLHDRTTTVRQAFTEACAKIGIDGEELLQTDQTG